MKLYTIDNKEMMDISKIEASGPKLLISGSIMGVMPIQVAATGAEMRKVLPMLSVKVIYTALRMFFSKSNERTL